MDLAPILQFLLLVAVTRCRSDATNGYHTLNGASQFGELLKPPPPPPLSPLVPVPFHGGGGRLQRQNLDLGYQYNPPPPPPPPPNPTSSELKFPAPFYKQYNFNFVPPPQPFTPKPSSLFQKVSGWLFPSQQTSYDAGTSNQPQVKKDCNPCNLVPWIPVIRYDLGAKNVYHSSNPTYGPPSPTAYVDSQNINAFKPVPFRSHQQDISTGTPQGLYGPPPVPNNSNLQRVPSSTYGPPISTYGPPSPTDIVSIPESSPLSSTLTAPSSSYPSSTYGFPNSYSSSIYSVSSTSQNNPSSAYSAPSYSYTTSPPPTPIPFSPSPLSATYGAPVTSHYEHESLSNQYQQQSDVELLKSPDLELRLPKVAHPTIFKNSYGEPISNNYLANIPYSVSATAAESTKIKTEVLPDTSSLSRPNGSLALANPAPFSLNRGRNIHTLQPVALPNLSVSPLPPIFNARPFRPSLLNNIVAGLNTVRQSPNGVKVEQSVPLTEFTHSIDYPVTIIQSPIIDIDTTKQTNQSKAYRNIPNAYIVNDLRDISSQASEDHVATKTVQDASFESTGFDAGNDLYESGMRIELGSTRGPSNHKTNFADLRGVKDEDVDKYRTESNLQNIDSPLLYLKPSAPHKGYGNFVLALSTPSNENEYEIYDDVPSTVAPQASTIGWEESKTDYSDSQPPPTAAQESVERPKIVQIIVPYTNNKDNNQNNFDYGQSIENWVFAQEEEYQPRKIPSNTESSYISTVTENYNTPSTTTEETTPVTDSFESERIKTAAILNDLYDVKEPPFDIIKLQNNIDDWTEQEYSEHHKRKQKNRGFEKYAKQIPDDYFTTTVPSNYVSTNSYDYEYDHVGSSSNHHSIFEDKNNTQFKPYKEYNAIERPKSKHNSGKDEDVREKQRLHIYTAASSFRSTTTTTAAPWGKLLTSISPLTKEKIYVVTSKPWREDQNATNDWYAVQPFESKKTSSEKEITSPDAMPFKSPRFINRPAFTSDDQDAMNSGSSYGFSRSWYESINNLENRLRGSNATWIEESAQTHVPALNEGSSNYSIEDQQSGEA